MRPSRTSPRRLVLVFSLAEREEPKVGVSEVERSKQRTCFSCSLSLDCKALDDSEPNLPHSSIDICPPIYRDVNRNDANGPEFRSQCRDVDMSIKHSKMVHASGTKSRAKTTEVQICCILFLPPRARLRARIAGILDTQSSPAEQEAMRA